MNNWIGFLTLLKKECSRFYKVIVQTVFSPVISNSLYLLIFGVTLLERIGEQNGVNYLQFIIPGLIAMGILNNALQNSLSSINISKYQGDLLDLKVVPLGVLEIVFAYALAAVIRGLCVGIVITIVGQCFYWFQFQTLLPIHSITLLLMYSILSGFIFGFLGICIGMFVNSFDQVTAITTFILLPLTYLGGVFFSIENLHPIWQTASKFNPIIYIINGIRYSFLGVSDISTSIVLPLCFLFAFLLFVGSCFSVKYGKYSRF